MAINKVVYGGNTLIDITDTTATASDVFSGRMFYGANGNAVVGTATGIPSGGSANEVLIKESNTDYDVGWGSFGDIVPSSGIDAAYMAAAVQSSLALADSAYQLPATGIPSTDIADGVIPQYESKSAVSGGSDLSLVTTGEKYIWTANALPAVTSADEGKIMRVSNGLWTCALGMAILSYGHSTWAEFLAAYSTNTIVYCRASSNSNPASGSQTRMAFMAYVNNADPNSITNVEFQYYRSMNSHSITAQGDQVFVYKLDKTAGWTVTVREASVQIVNGTGLSRSYTTDKVTLAVTNPLPAATSSDNGKLLSVVSGAPAWANYEVLPSATSSDQGKVLEVNSSGQWIKSSNRKVDPIAIDILYDSTESKYYIDGSYTSIGWLVSVWTDHANDAHPFSVATRKVLPDNSEKLFYSPVRYMELGYDSDLDEGTMTIILDLYEDGKMVPHKFYGVDSDNVLWEDTTYKEMNLPDVTSSDEGKALVVDSQGEWVAGDVSTPEPKVFKGTCSTSSSNNSKTVTFPSTDATPTYQDLMDGAIVSVLFSFTATNSGSTYLDITTRDGTSINKKIYVSSLKRETSGSTFIRSSSDWGYNDPVAGEGVRVLFKYRPGNSDTRGWEWIGTDPSVIYTNGFGSKGSNMLVNGSGYIFNPIPGYTASNANQYLSVNSTGTGVVWKDGNDVFIITVTNGTPDKTYDEAYAAYQAHKVLILIDGGITYYFQSYRDMKIGYWYSGLWFVDPLSLSGSTSVSSQHHVMTVAKRLYKSGSQTYVTSDQIHSLGVVNGTGLAGKYIKVNDNGIGYGFSFVDLPSPTVTDYTIDTVDGTTVLAQRQLSEFANKRITYIRKGESSDDHVWWNTIDWNETSGFAFTPKDCLAYLMNDGTIGLITYTIDWSAYYRISKFMSDNIASINGGLYVTIGNGDTDDGVQSSNNVYYSKSLCTRRFDFSAYYYHIIGQIDSGLSDCGWYFSEPATFTWGDHTPSVIQDGEARYEPVAQSGDYIGCRLKVLFKAVTGRAVIYNNYDYFTGRLGFIIDSVVVNFPGLYDVDNDVERNSGTYMIDLDYGNYYQITLGADKTLLMSNQTDKELLNILQYLAQYDYYSGTALDIYLGVPAVILDANTNGSTNDYYVLSGNNISWNKFYEGPSYNGNPWEQE